MVPLLDGYLEIGGHVRSNICYLICLRHLIRSRAVTKLNFFIAQHDLNYYLKEVPWSLDRNQQKKFENERPWLYKLPYIKL